MDQICSRHSIKIACRTFTIRIGNGRGSGPSTQIPLRQTQLLLQAHPRRKQARRPHG